MTITWPSILTPTSGGANLRNMVRSGGRTLSGREQRVFNDAGFWEISYSFTLRTSDQVRAWRALMGRLRSGEEVNLPLFDRQRAGLDGTTSTATLSADAALRSTTVSFSGVNLNVEEGHHFSVGNRLYVISQITSATEFYTGPLATILGSSVWSDSGVWVEDKTDAITAEIRPPLRAALTSGTTINFETLRCKCVLADMGEGDLSLDLMRFGSVSVTFVEYI